MQGSKLKFFWDNMLGSTGSVLTLVSGSVSTGDYSVDYVHNWLEVNSFKQSTVTSQYLVFQYDSGAGNTKTADYFFMYGHNIASTSLVYVEHSSSGAFAGEQTGVFYEFLGTTGTILREFSSASNRYWRAGVYTSSAADAIGSRLIKIMSLGTKTELDYIQPPFDPYGQETKANVNLSQGGYVTGIHEKYTERDIQINLLNQSTSVYNAIKTWRETHGVKNFAMAWDSTGSSADVWLVRPDMSFKNPINVNHLRDITINLKGRKV